MAITEPGGEGLVPRDTASYRKALTTMNVQLANAISDVSGVTGMAIVRAILGRERDPYVVGEIAGSANPGQ